MRPSLEAVQEVDEITPASAQRQEAGTLPSEPRAPSRRIMSLDALRGFVMFWLMNGQALVVAFLAVFSTSFSTAVSRQLEHSRWHGCTAWDIVFPLFLFVVGLSIPLSISKRLQRGESRKGLYKSIVKRTLLLILLGFIVNGLLRFNLANFRYAGVLQRIALCYFFAALIVMNTRVRGQSLFAGGLLLVYWAAMMLVPVPGFGAGVLTPEGNLSYYLDRWFLPGCHGPGDNCGLLSTLPAISTTLFGVLCGQLLQSSVPERKKTEVLLGCGLASLILALVWNLVFPINKPLWTSSYVLYGNGWSMLLLCLFYWVIDVRGYRNWAFPFMVIGLNAITIYVVQSQFDVFGVANAVLRPFVQDWGVYRPLLVVASVVAIKWLFLYLLWRRRIFLKA